MWWTEDKLNAKLILEGCENLLTGEVRKCKTCPDSDGTKCPRLGIELEGREQHDRGSGEEKPLDCKKG